MMNTGITEQAATAHTYAMSNLAIFPLWWADNGRCACPRGRLPELHNNYCGRTSAGEVKGSPGKHPMTKNGVKAATTNPAQVADWWQRAPLANIGLAAGANGQAIIDVDPRHGGDDSLNRLVSFAAHLGVDLLDTMSSRTGSQGLHLFYAAPVGIHSGKCAADMTADGPNGCRGCIRNGQGNKPPFGADMPGLDTRGYGGYVVAPPSTHISGGVYEWINFVKEPRPWPPVLAAVIEAAYRPAPAAARRAQPSGDTSRYAQTALTREIEQLRATGEGGRNAQLNAAAFNLGQLVGAGALTRYDVEQELASAAQAIGLTEAETRATVRSGIDKGITQPRTIPMRAGAA